MSQLTISDDRNNHQIALLSQAQQTGKLNRVDLAIADSNSTLKIQEMPRAEVSKELIIITKFICRDLGIKTWNNEQIMKYDATRFVSIIQKYYSHLSLEDIKQAFELLLVGELDEYLPVDKNGNVLKEHYQSFNVQYYTKVLDAYNRKKGKVWSKVRKSLPPVERVVTQAEKDYYKLENLKLIWKNFEDYRDHQIPPNFIFAFIGDLFIKADLIKPPEINDKKAESAIEDLRKKANSISERRDLLNERGKGAKSSPGSREAYRIEMNRKIQSCYEVLISDNKHLKEVLNEDTV
jgi:hypothetical protein